MRKFSYYYVKINFLQQDWKGDCLHLGSVRRYDPVPPPPVQLDISKFPLKLATVTRDETKRGWGAYKISLSNDVRSLHLNNPVHGSQWRDLILDFDKKFFGEEPHEIFSNTCFLNTKFLKTKIGMTLRMTYCSNHTALSIIYFYIVACKLTKRMPRSTARFCANMAPVEECTAMVPAEVDEEMANVPAPWTDEPTNLDALLDAYIVEQKISGKWPGSILYLTTVARRDGSVTGALQEQQKYKLFLVSRLARSFALHWCAIQNG